MSNNNVKKYLFLEMLQKRQLQNLVLQFNFLRGLILWHNIFSSLVSILVLWNRNYVVLQFSTKFSF